MKTIIAALFALVLGSAAVAQPEQARVIDGDTIELNGKRIGLWVIDAPERGATPAATAAIDANPADSQHDRELTKALYSSAEIMESKARHKVIAAWIIGVFGGIYVFCRWYRWIWRGRD